MRGLWRPMAVYGAATIALTSVLFVGKAPLEYGGAALFAATVMPVPLMLSFRGVLPVSRFLVGLSDAGVRYQVTDDRVGWLGSRRLTLRTHEGTWHLVSRNGSAVLLRVRGPHLPRHQEVRGEWRRAGRMAGHVLLWQGTR